MNLVHRILGAALAAATLAAAAQAAPISTGLAKALDRLGSNGKVRILVQMKDAAPVMVGAAQSVGDTAGRLARLKALHANAAKSQKALLETVKPLGVNNAVESGSVHSLWLANMVALDADRAMIEKLASRADVKAVFLNETIPAPKVVPSAVTNVPGDYTWGLTRIHVPEVHRLYKLTGAGVRVGHLDTGVTGDHPDLKGKVLLFKDFSQKAAAQPYDDEGHGSHTAGTICGGDASGKHIGVAPDAKLICAKIFGPNGATLEGILGAMEWVVDPDGNPNTDDGAQIVSNSWGSDNAENRQFWDPVKKWVDLGVFPCFAAGNNGPHTVGTPGGFPHSFAVGAVDPDDKLSEFSSRGPVTWDGKELVKPDVAAPGSGILSAWNTGNGYTAIQGTSMACPHVSGVVALLLQANPKLTIDRIRQILESTADHEGDPGKNNLYGSGIVNAWKAVAQVVPSGDLAGTLKDEAGQPVQGEVSLPDYGVTVKSSIDGKFDLLAPAGTYKVSAKAFGFKLATFSAKVVAGQPSSEDVAMSKAQEGKFSGNVENSDGKPLKASISFPGTSLAAVETTSDTGVFDFAVPRGQYTIVVKSFGYEPKVITDLTIGAKTAGYKVILSQVPDILVVDADGYDKLETYFYDSLTRLGRKFSKWDVSEAGAPSADVLVQYSIVIWQTGYDYKTAFAGTQQDAVAKYLASGGHLYISGQLAGVALRNTPFYANSLHAKFVTLIRRSQASIPALVGTTGSPLGEDLHLTLNGDGSQNNQDYPNIIKPADAKAKLAVGYEHEARGGAAIAAEDGASKLLYAAFGLEGITGVTGRDDFMKRVLTYLAPKPTDVLARVEAVDGIRRQLLKARAPEANTWFEFEDYFIGKASKTLAGTPDAEQLLSKFVTTSHASSAMRAIRREAQGRLMTR